MTLRELVRTLRLGDWRNVRCVGEGAMGVARFVKDQGFKGHVHAGPINELVDLVVVCGEGEVDWAKCGHRTGVLWLK